MAFELNSAIPMSYNYGPSVLEQAQSIMTLADMMDKRKKSKKLEAANEALGPLMSNLFPQEEEAQAASVPVSAQERMNETPIGMALAGTDWGKAAIKPKSYVAPASVIPEAPVPQVQTPYGQTNPDTAAALMGKPVTPQVFGENGLPVPEPVLATPPVQAPVQPVSEPAKQAPDFINFTPEEHKMLKQAFDYGYDVGQPIYEKMLANKKIQAETYKMQQGQGYGNTELGLNLKYAQDPEYVANVQENIQKLIDSGKIPSEIGTQLKLMATTKPITARQQAYEYTSKIAGAIQQETETRPGKAQTAKDIEEATSSIKVKTAAAQEYAKTVAGVQASIDNISKFGLKGIDPTTGKAYTANQSAAAGFGLQMNQANDVIDSLANSGFDEGSLDNAILSQIGQGTTFGDISFNSFKDPAMKMYAQAKFAWAMAYLRKTSGAAINKDEYQSAAKIYFGQYGDTSEVLAQKRAARLNQTGATIGEAGNAYKEFTDSIDEYSKQKEAANPYKSAAIKSKLKDFKSEAEAEAAGLKAGTEITINGRKAVIE